MNLTLQDNSSKLVLWVVILRQTPNNKTMLHSEMVKVLIILRAVFITPANLYNNPHKTSGASL